MTLKSVDDYNREKRQEREYLQRKWCLTGVACPLCGKELEWQTNTMGFVYPMPTIRQSRCGSCSLTIDLEV